LILTNYKINFLIWNRCKEI